MSIAEVEYELNGETLRRRCDIRLLGNLLTALALRGCLIMAVRYSLDDGTEFEVEPTYYDRDGYPLRGLVVRGSSPSPHWSQALRGLIRSGDEVAVCLVNPPSRRVELPACCPAR
jgi:hypothetical protein